jgi:hypothetical protein
MARPQGDLQLAIGYWIVSHKSTLKKWWAITLMSFIGISFIWSVAFFTFFFRGQTTTDDLVAQAAGRLGRLTLGVNTPLELIPGSTTVLVRDRQHVDVVARVENPNADWGAVTVTFHWQLGDQSSSPETAFINPKSTRPLISLNISVTTLPTSADLVIDDVEWTRVGSASLPPAIFVTDSMTVTPTVITVGGQSVDSVSLKAKVTNHSVYNYFRVAVPVLVMAGDRIVAVDSLNYERWPTLTIRDVAASWSYAVSGATTAEILPQVSQFAADNIYR